MIPPLGSQRLSVREMKSKPAERDQQSGKIVARLFSSPLPAFHQCDQVQVPASKISPPPLKPRHCLDEVEAVLDIRMDRGEDRPSIDELYDPHAMSVRLLR